MPTRIRLQRHGKKHSPFYSVVIADGRAPRDGRFIEKIGTYNPMTDPAKVDLKFDRALYWINCGAQPSDTVRSILSKEGVMLKKHLSIGIKKGALTEEQAEAKFQEWKSKKEADLSNYKNTKLQSQKLDKSKVLENEAKLKDAKAEEVNKKRLAAEKKNQPEVVVSENEDNEENIETSAEVENSENSEKTEE